MSSPRFYLSLVLLAGLVVVFCGLAVVRGASPGVAALALPFLVSLGALVAMRSAATDRQVLARAWVAGGGVVVGFLAIGIVAVSTR